MTETDQGQTDQGQGDANWYMQVYTTLGTIRDAGTSLLIVEQQVPRAIALADVVVVLGKGAVRYAGPADEIGDLVEELLPTS